MPCRTVQAATPGVPHTCAIVDSGTSSLTDVVPRLGDATWRVLVVDAPLGSRRSELLDALAAHFVTAGHIVATAHLGPGCRTPAQVAGALRGSLRGHVPSRRAGALAALVDDLGPVATNDPVVLVLDDVHRGDASFRQAVSDLMRRLPASVRTVLGGAGLDAELEDDERPEVWRGRGVRWLGVDDLPPARPLRRSDLRTAAELDLTETDRRVLGTAAHLGLTRRDHVERLVTDLGGDTIERLRRAPGVDLQRSHVAIDERWRSVLDVPHDVVSRVGASLARVERETGDLVQAARIASLADSDAEFIATLRTALAVQPPRVGARTLREWNDTHRLAPGDPYAVWLDGACRAAHGAPLADVADRLESAGRSFRETGDVDSEIAVGMAAAMVARRRDDVAAMAAFIGRAHEVAGTGVEAAVWSAKLGEALRHQMMGDPHGALAILDEIPPDAFAGDWAAQVEMMRGTNRLLSGDIDGALRSLERATGWGGDWSYATALHLLGTARWLSGDGVGALRDLEVSERAAAAAGARTSVELACTTRAAMAAAHELSDPGNRGTPTSDDPEHLRLHQLATTFDHVARGDIRAARELLATIEPPERTIRSTAWVAALSTALDIDSPRWAAAAERHPPLRAAVDAGRHGRRFLVEGVPAPLTARPFLAAAWCERPEPTVEIMLLGTPTVRIDGRLVDDRSWDRSRVRELALYLATAPPAARDVAATRLWPDLAGPAAQQNLRVTLTYLLDVVDPERSRGAGSRLIAERGGTIAFATSPSLRIDVRDVAETCRRILHAAAAGDRTDVLAAARALDRHGSGPLLGGTTIGSWYDETTTLRLDDELAAIAEAAEVALTAGDPALASRLAERGIDRDPWAERLHRLAVRARADRDDLDGARRAMRRALRRIAELNVHPEPTTRRLADDLGVALG